MAKDAGAEAAKARIQSARVEAAEIGVAMQQARMAQEATIASARAASVAAKAHQDAVAASARTAAAAAKAQIDGMAAMSRMLNEKRLADAKAEMMTAKTAAAQAKTAASADKATASQAKATAAVKASAPVANEAAQAQSKLGQSAYDAARGSTQASGAVGTLQSMLAKLGPQGQAAAIVIGVWTMALVALTGALHSATSAAIGLVGQRSQILSVFQAFAGPAGGAGALAMVDKLSAALPIARAKIEEWARSLVQAGITGKALERAVTAIASAQALMGDSGASAALGMIEAFRRGGVEAAALVAKLKSGLPDGKAALAGVGLTVKDLAAALGMTVEQMRRTRITSAQMSAAIEKALQKKGAGPLQELWLSLPVLIAKARESFMSLFSGLAPAVKPFMAAIKALLGEFGKGTSLMGGMRGAVTAVLGTLFGWATRGVNAIRDIVKWFSKWRSETSVLGPAIAILKWGWTAVVAVLKVVWAAAAGVVQWFRKLLSNAQVLMAIKVILGIIAAALVAVVVVVAVIAAFWVIVFAAVVAVIGTVVAAVLWLVGAIADMVSDGISTLSGFASGASDAAADFISGLVAGIVGGASAVVGAVKGLASSALGAFTGVLGIKSPSTVMLKHGEENIAGAAATGIDKGSDKVDAAMAGLGGGKPGGGKGKRGGSDGVYIDLRGATFYGTDESLIRRVIAKVWEEVAGEAAEPVTT